MDHPPCLKEEFFILGCPLLPSEDAELVLSAAHLCWIDNRHSLCFFGDLEAVSRYFAL